MPRFAANLSLLFTELPFLDRFQAAAEAGFKGVEFLFPYAFDGADIRARLDAHGLELVLFNLPPGHWDEGERGVTALAGREAEFAAGLELALRYAETLGCRQLHAMAGLESHGARRDVYEANLAMAASWAGPEGVAVLIEPINRRDMPGYFLAKTAEAADIIAATGADNLHLQFDLYHREVEEGGLSAAIDTYRDITRHYQAASPPDRSEPCSGLIDYPAIFRQIDMSGYSGWIGCEYKPRAGTLQGLGWLSAPGIHRG